MRKEKTEVKMEEITHVETRVFCDLCGVEAKGDDWEGATYQIHETEIEITIRQQEGTSYPEGGCGTKIIIDMCLKCFKGKLVPWLKSQGATIKEEEWDW